MDEGRDCIRLVALDLDGTLLRSDGSISARTHAALAATRCAGIVVVFVTARPPRRLRALARETGMNGVALCSNGAVVYDLHRDRIAAQTQIDVSLAHALIGKLRELLPGVEPARAD